MEAERSEWHPFPAGVYMAAAFGPLSILLLVVSVLNSDLISGVASLFIGGYAIFEVGTAAYTAGMRRIGR